MVLFPEICAWVLRREVSGTLSGVRRNLKLRFVLILALLPGAALSAQVTLPKILASHMVVQRDLPVHVWGMAAAGEQVTVSFRGETRTTKAGPLGRWSVYLKPGAAGGPFVMTVNGAAGEAPIALDDVLVGDVWVASGQSNMEFMMHQAETAAQDLPKAGIADIRLLVVKKQAVDYPLDGFHDVRVCYIDNGWQVDSIGQLLLDLGDQDSRAIELRLNKNHQHSVVLHSVIDARGNWLSAPKAMGSRFIPAARPAGYRVQLISAGDADGYAPISAITRSQLEALYFTARQALVPQILKQVGK